MGSCYIRISVRTPSRLSRLSSFPRLCFSQFVSPRFRSPSLPASIPADEPIDEEIIPGYDPRYRYHPNPGDVLNDVYELKAKIGWGSQATVWLAELNDRQKDEPRTFATIKILDCKHETVEDARHELSISEHIHGIKSNHRGGVILRTVADSFEISTPIGHHLCLAFQPMREPLWIFRRRFGQDHVTTELLPVFKSYIRILLEGLDYLHSECHIIHTDLKLDNILVAFEDSSVIERFVDAQVENPMPSKTVDGRTVYLCHNDFGPPSLRGMYPRITDFGLAQHGNRPGPLVFPIQPDQYKAPEVLLGTGWSYPSDIWNFAVMIYELLAGKELFQITAKKSKISYSAAQHVAEMIQLLGPVPPALLQKERIMRQMRWTPEIRNGEGKLCKNIADFFGGPFFTDEGTFLRNDLYPSGRRFSDTVPECIREDEKEIFLNFMRKMLTWEPERRATAKQLLDDPWLNLRSKRG